jgi:archaellum component FlaC
MREVEEKRKIDDRLRALEKDHEGLSQRHRTTLELLGEKSEQVEELKADILDVKQMYRQLADTMGKS